jgi:hypothetical protein
MGFLEDVKSKEVTKQKAQAYDDAMKKHALKTAYQVGNEDAYTAGMQEGLAAAEAQYTPNVGNPADANVTDEEVAAIQAAGMPMTMDSVMALRVPVKNADQVPGGLANQMVKGY